MTTIDPDAERKRLAEVYAAQSDEELEQVAAQGSDLTEIAHEVLRAELAKRGLYVGEMDEPPGEDAAQFRDLVTVRSFWNLLEAELAKGLLDAEGIEAFLFDDNMVRLDWFNANALGGVKVRVDRGNLEAAQRVLEEAEEIAPEDEEPA